MIELRKIINFCRVSGCNWRRWVQRTSWQVRRSTRQFQPSGAELEEAGGGRSPKSSGTRANFIPASAYRHQTGAASRGRRRLLQPARHLLAVHQRGQGRDRMDSSVRSYLCRQRGSPSASRRWLQSPQFRAKPGDAQSGRTVVASPAAPRKLIKIGAKVVSHGRYVTFQMAEVAVPRQMSADILSLIARLRAPSAPA